MDMIVGKEITEIKKEEPRKERKKYSGLPARILNLLISGATQEQTAAAVGVDPSYVSQLCAEEDFQLTIVESIRAASETAVAIDDSYLTIEKQLVDRLKTLVPWMTTSDQVLKTLRFVNEAKRKTNAFIPQTPGLGSSGPAGAGTSGTVVKIVLPTFITQQFVMNPNREIIAIGDQELVTLDSKQLNMIASQPRLSKPEVKSEQSKRSQTGSVDPWSDL